MRTLTLLAIATVAAACAPQDEAYNAWLDDEATFAADLAATPVDAPYAFLIADRYVATRGQDITFSMSTQPLMVGRAKIALIVSDGGDGEICPPVPGAPCLGITGEMAVSGPHDLINGEGSLTLRVPADWPHDGAFIQTLTVGKGQAVTSNVLYVPVVDAAE